MSAKRKKAKNPIPMVPTTLNVASWLYRLAYLEGITLQPLKLHRVLYLVQGHFAALNDGRAFMPASFVATKKGPIEPNLYQVLVSGIPDLDPPPQAPNDEAIAFLEVVWRKYGHHSSDHLLKVISRDEAFFKTMEIYPGGVIPLSMMTKEYLTGAEAGKIDMPKRYTQTGKVMTDWSITKDGDPGKVINGRDETQKKRTLTVAEQLALDIAKGGVAEKAQFLEAHKKDKGFEGMSAQDMKTVKNRSGRSNVDPSTVVGQLADELAAKHRPITSIEDAADAEDVAMRILTALGGAGSVEDTDPIHTPQTRSTERWKPEQAPQGARILRSSSKVNSAPGGGLPWRK